MCIFHFCHSRVFPFILKETPSGCKMCKGLRSSRGLYVGSFSSIRSGRKSHGVNGGGIRSRFDLANDSFDSGKGSVVSTVSLGDPSAECLYLGGKSIWTTFSDTESTTGMKS